MPPPLASRALLFSIRRHTWTFAGSGQFRAVAGNPVHIEIRGCPLCRGASTAEPVCDFYAAIFERLFQTLVSPAAHAEETECEAEGGAACRFEIARRRRLICLKAFGGGMDRTRAKVRAVLDPIVAKYLHLRVPRYTSYPTAPHFSQAAGEGEVRNWFGALDAKTQLSLYLHIPFCQEMCLYCGCNMRVVARYDPVSAYVARLLDEIHSVASALPSRMTVCHVHWGGGTPNILAPDDFAQIDEALRTRFDFAEDTEIAVETDPRTLTADTIAALVNMGCNRISMGVQEFDVCVQQAINRVQPFDLVARATEDLRAAGIAAINFDLMYGLPHQTCETLVGTIDRSVTLQPGRIALFGYAHVPWMAKNQRLIDESKLPDAVARFEMAEAAGGRLAALGYDRIGIDHFALPHDSLSQTAATGRLRRNFQGYTDDRCGALLGFGASAISSLPDGYSQNIVEPGGYTRSEAEGALPIAKTLRLTAEDKLRRAIIERLMCDFSVDLQQILRQFGMRVSTIQASIDGMRPFIAEGLVQMEGSRVRIADAGRPLARVIAASFDAYLVPDSIVKRHATV